MLVAVASNDIPHAISPPGSDHLYQNILRLVSEACGELLSAQPRNHFSTTKTTTILESSPAASNAPSLSLSLSCRDLRSMYDRNATFESKYERGGHDLE